MLGRPDNPTDLARALSTIGRRLPLVVLIDDLDAASDEFLYQLANVMRATEGSFLLVASTAPQDLPRLERCAVACSARLRTVKMQLLDRESLARIFEVGFGFVPSLDNLAWLMEVSKGLPVLIGEMLDHLVQTRCIMLEDGEWRQRYDFIECPFPPLEARPLLREQLEPLSMEHRRTLATIALIGCHVSIDALELIGLQTEQYHPLVEQGLLLKRDGAISFAHGLICEAARSDAQDANLHADLRTALVSLMRSAVDGDVVVGLPHTTLMRLFDGAGAEEREMLLDGLFNSIQPLKAASDYTTACRYALLCREWWSQVVVDRMPEEIAAWTTVVSDLFFHLGRIHEQRLLLEEFLEAHDQDDQPLPPELLTHVVNSQLGLAEYYTRQKNAERASACVEAASARLSMANVDENHRLSLSVAYHRADILRMLDRHSDAMPIYADIIERTGSDQVTAAAFRATIALNNVGVSEEEQEFVRKHTERMMALCAEQGHQPRVVQLRACLIGMKIARKDYIDAVPMVESLIRETQEHSLPRTESNAWSWLAIIYEERGDYQTALKMIERTIAIRWRVRSIAMWQIALISRARIQLGCGRYADVLATIKELERDAELHDRPYRHFLVEFCRTMVQLRTTGELPDRSRLRELRKIGEDESFEGTESTLLELEGEMLMHESRVTSANAFKFFDRVVALGEAGLHQSMLNIVAAAAVGRSLPGGSSSNGKRKRGKNVDRLEEVRTRVLNTLSRWEHEGARHNIATALGLLRMHADNLFNIDDLEHYVAIETEVASDSPGYRSGIVTFGRLRVLDPGGAERGGRHFGTHKSDSKPRKMLAALAAAAVLGRRLTRERLVDMVWGEDVSIDSASNNFHVTLSGLRQVVGEGVDFDGSTYALNPAMVQLDALEFLEIAGKAEQFDRAGKIYQAFDLFNAASQIYSGEFLEGIFDQWSDGPREVLRARARSVRLRLAEIGIECGEHDIARLAVQQLFESNSADEEAMRMHLNILIAEGDRVRALSDYDRFVARLRSEHGIEPSESLQELARTVA
jgi:DNA-binding SARP family transcriptional activator